MTARDVTATTSQPLTRPLSWRRRRSWRQRKLAWLPPECVRRSRSVGMLSDARSHRLGQLIVFWWSAHGGATPWWLLHASAAKQLMAAPAAWLRSLQ
jgi:hypothetical protein